MKLVFPAALRPHGLYIAGNPGSGKTSLIQDLALRDIKAGRGVCVIDPTGDLVDRLVNWVPKSRVNDTIFFDSSDPVPIDFFSYHNNEDERQVLTDSLVAIFDLENAPRARPYLRKILGTLFDFNDAGGQATFLDILRFIESETYRKEIWKKVPQREWKFFPKPIEFEAISVRMITFQESKSLRTIFGAQSPKLNIWDIMQEKKVFLVNLKDTPTDLFLGSLICAKFQQATFRRRELKEAERKPYYLYIDECNTIMKYAAQEFDAMLLRARKYKLCLTMTNQIPSKLPTEIQDSLGTIGSLVLFNLDTKDGRIFKDKLNYYSPETLVNLEPFHAIARVGNQVNRVKTATYLGFSPASYAPSIKNRTKTAYACNTPQTCLNKGDGNNTASKTEEIQPGPAPDVPPHERKKKNA